MNIISDIIPKDFNYYKCLKEYKLNDLLGESIPTNDPSIKKICHKDFAVDNKNKEPFPSSYDDLIRLHYLCRER